MSLPRLLPVLACMVIAASLSSCQFDGKVDAQNPTVEELDALDVQWGLAARKSRGGPRRTFQYVDPSPSSVSAAAAPAPVTPAPARETINTAPPASFNPEPPVAAPAVVVPSNLR